VPSTPRSQSLAARIAEALDATHVAVDDESHLHSGHAGAAGGGGHFRATIVTPRFEGLSRVARQRLVYEALADEMKGEIHALAMRTYTPEEWAAGAGNS
jgi:BolA protein